MIDLHSHILPNIDDGSSSAFESFIMLKEAEKAGFTDIIATPHYMAGITRQDPQSILNQIEEINQAAQEQGIHIKVHPGEEIYATPDLIELLKSDKLINMGSSKNILVEFAIHDKPKFMENLLFELCNLGYTPIIAHPERYIYVQNKIELVSEWQNMGAKIQCNYGSLIGRYGHAPLKVVVKLLKNKQVDYMGSDCHSAGSVYDDMFDVMKKLEKIVDDQEYLKVITTDNAKRLLA